MWGLPEGLASVASDLELRQEAVGMIQEHSRELHPGRILRQVITDWGA